MTAGEAIAVKQVELPSTMSDKEDLRIQGMVASLKAEIELLKDLAHDNIVEYLGAFPPPHRLLSRLTRCSQAWRKHPSTSRFSSSTSREAPSVG